MISWLSLAHAASPEPAIEEVLDGLHRAASEADADDYFGRFTPDAVFVGTDPTERWTLDAFRTWAGPRFEEAPAWSYTPLTRNIVVGPGGRTAWFDEMLRHASYGDVRGSGALVRKGKEWKVAHYVLSFAVPNDVAKYAVEAIRGEAFLPTPFTAAQIRAAMPVGTLLQHEQTKGDAPPQRSTWEVTAADDQGCTIVTTREGTSERSHTWTELRDHARFPAPLTTVTDERIDTALGPLDCRRYTIRPASEPGHTRHMWFCPDVAGAPVRIHVVDGLGEDDRILDAFELVSRALP